MISLKPYNTFGVESFATELIHIYSEQDLLNLDLSSRSRYRILGGGSNILLTHNIDETILKNEIKGIEIISEDATYSVVKVGAGEIWHDVVLWALDNNLGGIENLSLIPGNAGAAPVQNIGAYGVELKDVLLSLEGIFISDRKKKVFKNEDCKFSYRDSLFKSTLKADFFICSIVIQLQKKHQLHLTYGNIKQQLDKLNIQNPTIRDISNVVIAIRNAKLPNPRILGNAGSFFKNSMVSTEDYNRLKEEFPEIPAFVENSGHLKIPSGWLIEQCGWKGKRIGDVGCYEKQALVIVNYGNASGTEIQKLANEIIDSVFQKFGIKLTPEVNIW